MSARAVDWMSAMGSSCEVSRAPLSQGAAHLALLLQQEELRQNGDRLQVDRECPNHLEWRRVVLVDEHAKHRAWRKQVLHRECVFLGVVRGLLRHSETYEVDDGCGGGDEEELEHIDVTSRKDDWQDKRRVSGGRAQQCERARGYRAQASTCIHLLRAQRDTRSALAPYDLVQQQNE
eukprot:scaffold1216_cov164-Isochrysis_galbana.AAC.3